MSHQNGCDLNMVEFLRFGSSIPGNYWGCCAVDIIQCFKSDPNEKASAQLVDGDGGIPITNASGKPLFAGPTNKDIFLQRLRVGTFGSRDMPNHAFIAILTDWQIKSTPGKLWLPILKEAGFEFVRTVSNSVYSGKELGPYPPAYEKAANYIFALFRNIGTGAIKDPYTPPKEWTDLSQIVPEAWTFPGDENWSLERSAQQHAAQTEIWNKIGPAKFVTEEELVAAGAPVIMSGVRGGRLPERKEEREKHLQPKAASAFPTKVA